MYRLAGVLVLIALAASCSSADETAADPWGAADVPEPATQEEVNVIFLGMPATLDGMTAYRDDPEHVGFVDYSSDTAWASIAWIEAGPGAAAAIEMLEGIGAIPDFEPTSSNLEVSSSFIWLAGTAPGENGLTHLAWWGEPSDGWIFSAEADTAEHLDAVIAAFIASAAS